MAVAVALSLGSNLGDRRAHLEWAVRALAEVVLNVRASPVIEYDAAEVAEAQPPYLNMAVVGATDWPAADLMHALLDLERRQGRTRGAWHAPRTLDLDLILYGEVVIQTPGLVVPHPRFRTRRFVLEPLAAIAPDWIDPVTGQTVAALFEELRIKNNGA